MDRTLKINKMPSQSQLHAHHHRSMSKTAFQALHTFHTSMHSHTHMHTHMHTHTHTHTHTHMHAHTYAHTHRHTHTRTTTNTHTEQAFSCANTPSLWARGHAAAGSSWIEGRPGIESVIQWCIAVFKEIEKVSEKAVEHE